MAKEKPIKTVCSVCGSDQVQTLDWIDPNTGEVVGGNDCMQDSDTFCATCDAEGRDPNPGVTDLESWIEDNPGKRRAS